MEGEKVGVFAEPHGAADTSLLGQIGKHDAAPATSAEIGKTEYSAGALVRAAESIWSDEESIIVAPTDCMPTSCPHNCALRAAT